VRGSNTVWRHSCWEQVLGPRAPLAMQRSSGSRLLPLSLCARRAYRHRDSMMSVRACEDTQGKGKGERACARGSVCVCVQACLSGSSCVNTPSPSHSRVAVMRALLANRTSSFDRMAHTSSG
jgi:hypothetical protein